MPATNRRQTAFRCDDDLLTEFQATLKRRRMEMSPVIEGWIREYMKAGTTQGIAGNSGTAMWDAQSPQKIHVDLRGSPDTASAVVGYITSLLQSLLSAGRQDQVEAVAVIVGGLADVEESHDAGAPSEGPTDKAAAALARAQEVRRRAIGTPEHLERDQTGEKPRSGRTRKQGGKR